MLSKTRSVALVGTEGRLVELEVHIGDGIPVFRIVGLPATSVREAEQRVTAALDAAGAKWPKRKIVANLAPAGLRKEGTNFDLALAFGVLGANGELPLDRISELVSFGELAFDGTVRPVPGCLAAALACVDSSAEVFICPAANAAEAAAVSGLQVVPVVTLKECLEFVRGRWTPPKLPPSRPPHAPRVEDLSEVRGQQQAKRALEVAAAGGHNLLLKGSPGSGKTMLARRLPGILPAMTPEETLEVTRIHSVAGLLLDGSGLVMNRPFRSPHHSISLAGLVGGGIGLARPGEVSLASHGVLFMDELALYRADLLDALRGPIEDGLVQIARSGGALTFPSRFSLIAAANPCPCGFRDDPFKPCSCSDTRVRSYDARISGPILDRFDMQVSTRRLSREQLLDAPDGEPSDVVCRRVEAARQIQRDRYDDSAATNASVSKRAIDSSVELSGSALAMVGDAIDRVGLSGRGVTRVKRVARTIADLRGGAPIEESDVAEALALRLIDMRSEEAA